MHDPGREGAAIIRLKQMTFGSQVKMILVLALPTAALLFILFLVLQIVGAGLIQSDEPVVIVLASAMMAAFFAAAGSALQIAALGLLRLVPWRGPELKVEEPKHLAGIFE